jgi:hypothetical protein
MATLIILPGDTSFEAQPPVEGSVSPRFEVPGATDFAMMIGVQNSGNTAGDASVKSLMVDLEGSLDAGDWFPLKRAAVTKAVIPVGVQRLNVWAVDVPGVTVPGPVWYVRVRIADVTDISAPDGDEVDLSVFAMVGGYDLSPVMAGA